MIKEVIHDPIFLGVKSEVATKEDLQVAQDLLDTLIANKDGCVGMAANMIGVLRRIIVFDNEGTYMTMFNPEIIKNNNPLAHTNHIRCHTNATIFIGNKRVQ